MTAIDTLVADLNAGKYSSAAQNIIAPVADFVAALNEIQGNTTNGNFTSVTINANAPNAAPAQANGMLMVNGADGVQPFTNWYSWGAQPSTLQINRAQGTQAVPLATGINNVIGLFTFRGFDGAAFQVGAQIRGTATENWIAGSNLGMQLNFIATAAGGTTNTNALILSPDKAVFQNVGANGLAVGRQGATNPVLNVDTTVANVVTGINVKGAAAAAGVAISALSSGANENLTIDAKGSGTITLGSVSTGAIVLTRGLTLPGGTLLTTSAALTNNAAASAGTLTNAPAVGNPTKWIPINDNGTTRNIPAW